MSALKQLQDEFSKALFSKESDMVSFVRSDFAMQRIEIYKTTIQETLKNTLSLTYPGIWSLLGDECANQVAYFYCQDEKNLPSTGCLDDWGESFAAFLTTQPQLNALSYLEDFARYEWIKHLAFIAKSQESLGASAFQSLVEQALLEVKISFIPSFYLFESTHPIEQIQAVINEISVENVILEEEKRYAVIARPFDSLLIDWIDADLWCFLESLKQAKTLAQTITETLNLSPDFNLTHAFQYLISKKIVASIIKGDERICQGQ